MMDEVYDMYFENQLSTEIVDLLAESEFMSEEVFNKKLTRVFNIDALYKRFPKDGSEGSTAYSFP